MTQRETAYVGIGSNLEDPREQVCTAFAELDCLQGTRLVAKSSLYVSAPLGPAGQPDYINAVACLSTSLEPLVLLDELQSLEERHRRERRQHWGPRTLDLDILLYADQSIDLERLQIPHPHMHTRSFVLKPLLEIAPEIRIPGRGRAADWASQCDDLQTKRLND